MNNEKEVQKVVELNNVHKQFMGSTVIRGLSMEVRSREFIAITGHSGSGKSTLLRMMQCIESPDSGIVKILGNDVMSLGEKKRKELIRNHVGIGFQAPLLLGNFSVKDNISLPANGNGHKISPERLIELAKYFDMLSIEKLNQPAMSLSGGEQMRVSIMRALAPKPKLLLLDEPTSALDSSGTIQTFKGLRELVDNETDATTVVVVTHDADLCRDFIDREYIIENGQIVNEV